MGFVGGSALMFRTLFAALALGALVLLLLSAAERLVFVNASSYPAFLVNENIGDGFTSEWFLLKRQQCGDPLEIYEKTGGQSILRCGLAWPFSTTWRVDTPALKRAGL